MLIIMEYIPEQVFNIFGGKDEFLKLPEHKLPKVKRDYIDYVKYEDVAYPITRSMDWLGRKCVIFRLKMTYFIKSDENEDKDECVEKKITVVLFQRYTGLDTWTGASNPSGPNSFLIDRSDDYANLKLLINVGRIENVRNSYYNTNCTYILE